MAKKVIKMTESDLHRMIQESVKRVLKEGTTDQYVNDKWNEILKIYGADWMVEQIYTYLDDIQLREIIDSFKRDGYLDDEEDYAEDEYGY